MNVEDWKHGDEFAVLDLTAELAFKTASSLSFDLGKKVPREATPLPTFIGVGWLDVHYPCDGGSVLRIRMGLPSPYVSWESMRDSVQAIVAAMKLPSDVPYRIDLVGVSEHTWMDDPAQGVE